jgi:hypothetical protein
LKIPKRNLPLPNTNTKSKTPPKGPAHNSD